MNSAEMPLAPTGFPAEAFTPKLVSTLREGYGISAFKADAIAGLTVAIVALPLSMAIAIASHAPPEAGLYTAIIGGFLISALGGSRHQIGGPAGAFIVLLASIIDREGLGGLLIATFMAGIVMFAIGAFRLGTFIKYVPHPVTVGFTAGIAVIIFASQIHELFGLSLAAAEPAALVPKLLALWHAFPSFSLQAAAIAAIAIAIIVGLRIWRPRWPGFLIAVVVCACVAWLFHLDVQTIGTRFGGVPRVLPVPHLPPFTFEKIQSLLPDALAIALLGSIESLLSAVVADSMTGRRHRSNMELVAQGIANMGAAMFGGLTATGTIARTATNVRAGAHGPVSGILHAGFLLLFMAVAAPLLAYIPLAALAGILAVVSWNMAERAEFRALLGASRGDAAVLLATFLLTIFWGLTEGIMVGVMMGCLLFMHRMAQTVSVESSTEGLVVAESGEEDVKPFSRELTIDKRIVVHRISGAFFFGAAGHVSEMLERIGGNPKAFVLDMTEVPFVDSSAAHALHRFFTRAEKHKAHVWLAGTSDHLRKELQKFGIGTPEVSFSPQVETAVKQARAHLEKAEVPS